MEGVSIWLLIGAGAVFFGGIFIYVMFMIFLPEWVGITGKVALEAERSHRGGEPAGEEFLDKLHERKPAGATSSEQFSNESPSGGSGKPSD